MKTPLTLAAVLALLSIWLALPANSKLPSLPANKHPAPVPQMDEEEMAIFRAALPVPRLGPSAESLARDAERGDEPGSEWAESSEGYVWHGLIPLALTCPRGYYVDCPDECVTMEPSTCFCVRVASKVRPPPREDEEAQTANMAASLAYGFRGEEEDEDESIKCAPGFDDRGDHGECIMEIRVRLTCEQLTAQEGNEIALVLEFPDGGVWYTMREDIGEIRAEAVETDVESREPEEHEPMCEWPGKG